MQPDLLQNLKDRERERLEAKLAGVPGWDALQLAIGTQVRFEKAATFLRQLDDDGLVRAFRPTLADVLSATADVFDHYAQGIEPGANGKAAGEAAPTADAGGQTSATPTD